MAYETDFTLPRLGDGDSGGRITAWSKRPGDSFERDETLLEVETDKALVEVPAPGDGVVLRHLVDVDAVVAYRDPIARVKLSGDAPPAGTAGTAGTTDTTDTTDMVESEDEPSSAETDLQRDEASDEGGSDARSSAGADEERSDVGPTTVDGTARVFATPWARTLARERGVDLSTLAGSGKGGRVVGRDVERDHGVHKHGHRARGSSAPSASRAAAKARDDTTFDVEERLVDTRDGAVFARLWNPNERRVAATAVLFHGLFGDVDTWAASAAALGRRGVRVIAVDLPCHGRTTATVTELERIVETLSDALRTLADGPTVLIGHSYGGAVATRVASARALELHALTLIAPVGLGTAIDQSFLDGMTNARTLEALAREMRKLGESVPPPGEAWSTAMLERLGTRSESLARLCASAARSGVQQIDIVEDLETLSAEVPVRLVQGKSDRVVPWTQVLDVPPRVALHLLPGVGHMPHREASAVTTALLLDTLGAGS